MATGASPPPWMIFKGSSFPLVAVTSRGRRGHVVFDLPRLLPLEGEGPQEELKCSVARQQETKVETEEGHAHGA